MIQFAINDTTYEFNDDDIHPMIDFCLKCYNDSGSHLTPDWSDVVFRKNNSHRSYTWSQIRNEWGLTSSNHSPQAINQFLEDDYIDYLYNFMDNDLVSEIENHLMILDHQGNKVVCLEGVQI